MTEVINENKDILESLREFSQERPTMQQFKAVLVQLKTAYAAGKIENPSAIIDLILALLQSRTIQDVPHLLAVDENHFQEDSALGSDFTDETIKFAKGVTNMEPKTFIACQSGLLRSASLWKELTSPKRLPYVGVRSNLAGEEDKKPVDKDRFAKLDKGENGYAGMTTLGGYMARMLITNTIYEPFNLILFSNPNGQEICDFLSKIRQYLGDRISFDKYIDILNGDFSVLRINEIFIIQKPG